VDVLESNVSLVRPVGVFCIDWELEGRLLFLLGDVQELKASDDGDHLLLNITEEVDQKLQEGLQLENVRKDHSKEYLVFSLSEQDDDRRRNSHDDNGRAVHSDGIPTPGAQKDLAREDASVEVFVVGSDEVLLFAVGADRAATGDTFIQ